jgi:hypothetical protein
MNMLATILLLTWNVHAATVLIEAPQTRPLEYRAALKAHPEYVSPTEDYLAGHPSLEAREKLLNLFGDAQKSFLENSIEDARRRFADVIALILEDDWQRSDREIFLQSYLRLAQMETDSESRDRWLGQSLNLGNADFDKTLYPPPLIERRNEIAAQVPKRDLAQHLRGAGWSEILVNGQACGRNDCSAWPVYPGPVRLTVLSDQWLPQTRTMDVSELERWSPATTTWVSGTCRLEQFHAAAEKFTNKKVFWSLSCEKPGVTAVELSPPPAVAPALPLVTESAPAPVEKPRAFYQSGWFWAGVGAVVTVVAVGAASHPHDSKEPTTSYGY